MVEIGNWDVFILTFEETFYGYLINRTKIVKIFHKSAKISNMSNSPSLVTLICLQKKLLQF